MRNAMLTLILAGSALGLLLAQIIVREVSPIQLVPGTQIAQRR